jgi:hypothetical protein
MSDRQMYSDEMTNIPSDRQTDKHTFKQTDRQTGRQADRHRQTDTDRQTQVDRQMCSDEQTNMQSNRHTDKLQRVLLIFSASYQENYKKRTNLEFSIETKKTFLSSHSS